MKGTVLHTLLESVRNKQADSPLTRSAILPAIMDNPCKYHSWYHQAWDKDEFVNEADYETIGVYILLLQRQMAEGDIPNDIKRLAIQVGHQITYEKFLEIWETKGLKHKFVEVKRRWISRPGGSDPRKDGHWEDLKETRVDKMGCTRLFNEHLHQVMENDIRILRSKIDKKKSDYTPPVKTTSGSMEDSLEKTPTFDFEPILRAMPKRIKRGKRDGWEAGVELLKFITTQEEYDDLLAATRAYAKKCQGSSREDAEYFKSFKNWVNGDYREYVPAKSNDVPTANQESPKIEVVEESFVDTDAKINALRSKGKTVPDPPWTPDGIYTAERNAQRAAKWSEEKRASWLNKFLETGDV